MGFSMIFPSWFSSRVMLRPALSRSSVILKEERSPLEKIITCGAKDLAPEAASESELEFESESELES